MKTYLCLSSRILIKDKGVGVISYPIHNLFCPPLSLIKSLEFFYNVTVLYSPRKKYHGGIDIKPDADRYKYMSIAQLQDLTREMKEEAKRDPEREKEYHVAYKALEEKIRERDRKRPKCIPTRFEHELDMMEEF